VTEQKRSEEAKQTEILQINKSTTASINSLEVKYRAQTTAINYVVYVAYGSVGVFILLILLPDLFTLFSTIQRRFLNKISPSINSQMQSYQKDKYIVRDEVLTRAEREFAKDVDLRVLRYELTTLSMKNNSKKKEEENLT
jgi:hypothetical protein